MSFEYLLDTSIFMKTVDMRLITQGIKHPIRCEHTQADACLSGKPYECWQPCNRTPYLITDIAVHERLTGCVFGQSIELNNALLHAAKGHGFAYSNLWMMDPLLQYLPLFPHPLLVNAQC